MMTWNMRKMNRVWIRAFFRNVLNGCEGWRMQLELQSCVEWTKSARSASNSSDAPCPVTCAGLRKVVVLSSG